MTVELLAVEVAGREFGLDLGVVKEVIRPARLVHLRELPPFIAGVINFRGVAIPVVDLGTRFLTGTSSIPAIPARAISPQRLVICAVGQAVVAFAVDGAAEIIRLPSEEIGPPGSAVGPGCASSGVAMHGGRTLVCIDAKDLLSAEEKLSIESFRMRKEDLG